MSTTYTATAVQHSAYVLPSDGDDAGVSSVNAPIEALADGVKWCFDALPISLIALRGTVNGGTSTAISSSGTSFETTASTGSIALTTSGPDCAIMDEFHADVSFQAFGATTGAEYQLAYSVDAGTTVVGLTGARAKCLPFSAGGSQPVSLVGSVTMFVTATNVDFYLQARSLSGGATVSIGEPYTYRLLQYRRNT